MKTTSRTVDGIEILSLQGKITIGSGDVQLRDLIAQCLNDGKTNILLDMSAVSTIDSSGIGELVGSFTTVTNRGGRLKLLHLPGKVSDLLQVTQLITVFEVHENEAAAVASFK
ncbi:MAG: STAS domain-containing protein [Thermoanaerobaculia bacterium]